MESIFAEMPRILNYSERAARRSAMMFRAPKEVVAIGVADCAEVRRGSPASP